jgi:Ni,Fe-hydrogenase maturation factor
LKALAPELDEHKTHAHHLSAIQAIRLLEMIESVRYRLLGNSISSVAVGTGLSSTVDARMSAILDRVLQELGRRPPDNNMELL